MNKRGQIYIIAALILSAVIFLLVSQTNFVQRILIEDDFEQISKNFEIESAKLMNNLLAKGELDPEGVEQQFGDFTLQFSDYAKIENPNFEFIYVLDYKDQKIIGYYIKEPVEIAPGPPTGLEASVPLAGMHSAVGLGGISYVPTGEGEVVVVGDVSSIKIGSFNYVLKLVEGPQIVIISREERGEQTKVYLNEEFVKGEKVS